MATKVREKIAIIVSKDQENFELTLREGDFSDLEIIRELKRLLDQGYVLQKGGQL